ncbi:MAG: LacI family DNA-binding transcriptional regulator [bacterium]
MTTIHDVARAADVSIATVSRALNGSDHVSAATRQRVGAAAAALNYWPNGAARSLSTRRTHALGVLLPDLYGEFFSEVIRGVDHAAREEKLHTLVSSSHADADADTVLSAARSMRGRIDGLVIMAPDARSAEAIERIRQMMFVVLVNPRFEVDRCSSVSIANFDGARAVTEHLLSLGHRRVATIAGPQGNVDADERLRGYREALFRAGIEPSSRLDLRGDFTEASGYECADTVLRRRPLPTAVFAANDSMAVGLVSALGMRGIRVPGDMAVVGFDDIAIARYLNPPLTTVHVDAYELGARAVRLLISSIAFSAPASTTHEVLPAPLVIRESCGSGLSRARQTRPRAGHARAPSHSHPEGGPPS